METTCVISILALVFSIIALILTLKQNKKFSMENIRLQDAIFFIKRYAEFEGKLAEWPEAFKLYGIDLKKAEEDNISKEQISFLILSLNALCASYNAKGKSIYEDLKDNEYRRNMFSQKVTRKTWKYAKKCFSGDRKKDIDKYLMENYPNNNEIEN